MTLAPFPPISSLATAYVRAQISGKDSGVPINPTGDTVTMAVAAVGVDPVSFASASWETDATIIPNVYYARTLVATLAKGTYNVWVKFVDGSETVVMLAGEQVVY